MPGWVLTITQRPAFGVGECARSLVEPGWLHPQVGKFKNRSLKPEGSFHK
jgi:hypothetical protein